MNTWLSNLSNFPLVGDVQKSKSLAGNPFKEIAKQNLSRRESEILNDFQK
jgi:hypothetical protein